MMVEIKFSFENHFIHLKQFLHAQHFLYQNINSCKNKTFL